VNGEVNGEVNVEVREPSMEHYLEEPSAPASANVFYAPKTPASAPIPEPVHVNGGVNGEVNDEVKGEVNVEVKGEVNVEVKGEVNVELKGKVNGDSREREIIQETSWPLLPLVSKPVCPPFCVATFLDTHICALWILRQMLAR
jgi:hypothetical protein